MQCTLLYSPLSLCFPISFVASCSVTCINVLHCEICPSYSRYGACVYTDQGTIPAWLRTPIYPLGPYTYWGFLFHGNAIRRLCSSRGLTWVEVLRLYDRDNAAILTWFGAGDGKSCKLDTNVGDCGTILCKINSNKAKDDRDILYMLDMIYYIYYYIARQESLTGVHHDRCKSVPGLGCSDPGIFSGS